MKTDNGYKLIFDNTFINRRVNKANESISHNSNNTGSYEAGFGVEDVGIAYSILTGGGHEKETTKFKGGNLQLSIRTTIFHIGENVANLVVKYDSTT